MIDPSRRQILLTASALAALPAANALAQAGPKAAPAAGGIPKTWDLSELYKDGAAWTAEKDAVKAALPGLARFKGHLGDSAATLREALTTISGLSKRSDRLAVYSNLLADVDTTVAANQERRDLSTALGADFGDWTRRSASTSPAPRRWRRSSRWAPTMWRCWPRPRPRPGPTIIRARASMAGPI